MTRARDLANTALNNTVSSAELGYLDGVTSAIQTQLDAKAPTSTTVTLTGTQTLTNKTATSISETASVSSGYYTAAVQTENIAALPSVIYYTGSNTGNWTLNLRGSSSVTLNSLMAVGESKTVVIAVTNGATAYYQSALQLDGSAQTVKWSGGTAPSAGNANAVDIYSFTIIKTAATPTYTVFGAGPVKYA